MTTLDRFWAKVDVAGPDDCWNWTAAVSTDGYGRLGVGGHATIRAHRLAAQLRFGMLHRHQIVCHACDNPRCCNPAHLFVGTHLTNARDRDTKGRGNTLGLKNRRKDDD